MSVRLGKAMGMRVIGFGGATARPPIRVAAAWAMAGAVLSACSPAPKAAAPKAAPPPPVAAAPPAKTMKMVCRNSQTGADVECGARDAVMVGMKPG